MTVEEFDSGAIRDSQEGKIKFELITPTFKKDLAAMLTDKAKHYGDRNWEKGIPTARTYSSLLRHVEALGRGEWLDDESGHPHTVLAAANLMFIHEFHDSEFDTLKELVGPAGRKLTRVDKDCGSIYIYAGDDEPLRSSAWEDSEGDLWWWDLRLHAWTHDADSPFDWSEIDYSYFPMVRVS